MAQTKVKLISDGVIVQGNLHASHGITTADIGENASYLYYTDARVSSYLSTNGYATQTDIVAAITDSAPVTLDTLNELAAALGDDPNFAATTATSLGLKAPLASPSFTGNATFANRVSAGESFNSVKDGADTIADGPFFALKNAAGTRQYLWQLDASNNIDYWYYNGSTWTQTISLLNNGGATFAGSVTAQDMRLQASGTTYLNIGNDSTGSASTDGASIGYFTGQTSLQIVQRENDAIVLSTNSSPSVTILGNGNVGIGTTSPSAKLEVNGALFVGNHTGTVTPTSGIFIEEASGVDTQIQMYTYGGSVFRILGSEIKADIGWGSSQNRSVNFNNTGTGNISVGIGTDSPNRQLSIYGTNDGYMSFDGGRTGNHEFVVGSDSSGFIIYDDTLDTYRFVIDQDTGNVGIGTTAPMSGTNSLGLQIAKGAESSLFMGNPQGGQGAVFQTSDNRHRAIIGANVYDDPSSSWNVFTSGKGIAGISLLADTGGWGTGIDFWCGDTDSIISRMNISSNGNVNIGVTYAGSSAVTGPFVVSHTSSRFLTSSYESSVVSLSAKNNNNNLESLKLAGDSIYFFNGTNTTGSQSMVILNSGNVGIGVTSPAQKLSIKTNAVTSNPEYIEFTDAGSGSSWAAGQDYGGMQWFMGDGTGIGAHTVAQIKAQNEHTGAAGNAALVFSTAPYNTVMSERMRISSLGLITLSDIAYAVGSAGTSQPRFVPYGDNTIDLGYSGARWEQLWAATSTINTSDANEKQQIENLNEVELKVAKKLKGLIRKFKWNSAVEKKGEDARINFGIIAQDVKTAFESEGLIAEKYALFCSNTWWEKEVIEINELGNETKKIKILEEYEDGAIEKTRLGIRYSQLLAFIISAL